MREDKDITKCRFSRDRKESINSLHNSTESRLRLLFIDSLNDQISYYVPCGKVAPNDSSIFL
jgi:hypothetical protein